MQNTTQNQPKIHYLAGTIDEVQDDLCAVMGVIELVSDYAKACQESQGVVVMSPELIQATLGMAAKELSGASELVRASGAG